jgi:soluble lytic murein transglycosylase-like protein
MRNLRGTYVHRGDAARRRRRIQSGLAAAGSVALTVIFLSSRKTTPANAEPAVTASRSFFAIGDSRKLRHELETTQGELTLMKAQFERADKVIQFSTRFGITAGMASNVFDASVREGIDPELAFRLVRLESDFNEHAVSKVGAIGLAQVMPSTARLLDKSVTRERLFDGNTNLRVGFKYLRSLMRMYKGNVHLALLAYNRGEDAVWRDVKAGVDPGNGYDRWVMRDYKGKGTIDE